MKMKRLLIGFSVLLLAGCVPVTEQTPDVSTSGATISLASSSAPAVPETVSGALLIGQADAPVKMLLFTNYDCSYCADFQQNLLPRLLSEFVDSGKLSIQVVPVMLQKYPNSDRNAHILLCGVRVGSGADVSRQLFEGRTNFPALTNCLKDDAWLQSAMASLYEQTKTLDVSLVPTYFIDGERFTGLPDYAELRGQISEALAR